VRLYPACPGNPDRFGGRDIGLGRDRGRVDDQHVNGHARYYFRRSGVRKPLPGLPWSSEFMAAYAGMLDGTPAPVPMEPGFRHGVGSVAAAVKGYLASAEFVGLAATTRVSRRRILETFAKEHGHRRIADLERKHIVDTLLKPFADKPGASRNFISALRVLVRYAVDVGLRSDDPTTGIKMAKLAPGGHYSWNEDDIAAFEARHPVGSKARLALALLLYSGQRRADVIGLGWQHIRDGCLHLRQQKTGKALSIPIHPELQAVLDATPADNLTFLVSERGRPFYPDAFNHWFKKRCVEAGLPKRAGPHGLRKACCRRLAEAGCSAPVIAAISGHTSLREVQRYIAAAEQSKLAEQGMAAITRTPSGNPGDREWQPAKKTNKNKG
jgi:integrase